LRVKQDTPRDLGADGKERASQRPFDGNDRLTEIRTRGSPEPNGLFGLIWDIVVFVSSRSRHCGTAAGFHSGAERSPVSIFSTGAHGAAMSNHAPLHPVEIAFYSTACLLVVIALAWYFLR
jgi:hypothetical protein